MTKLHKTLEKLYFLIENIDPDNLTDKKVDKLRKAILKTQYFTKENIEFYSLDRFEAARIIKQSKIIANKAREIQRSLYTLELKKTRSEVTSNFDMISRIAINIELALGGPIHIYTIQYIATVMAINNNFVFQPPDKSINGMAKDYAQLYFDRYGITIKSDSLRKEYEGQFNKGRQKFIGAKKEIDRKIIKTYLSESKLLRLHKYLYDND